MNKSLGGARTLPQLRDLGRSCEEKIGASNDASYVERVNEERSASGSIEKINTSVLSLDQRL